MNHVSSLFKTFSADGTDGFADTSFASGPPGADASDSWVDGISSDTHAGNAAISTSLDAQTSNTQDPFLVSFEDGASAIVDETAFHCSNVSVVTPTTVDSTSNQHDGLKTVVAHLGWSAGTGSNAFD